MKVTEVLQRTDPSPKNSCKFKFKVINFGYNNLFILIKMLKEYYFSSPTIFEKKNDQRFILTFQDK